MKESWKQKELQFAESFFEKDWKYSYIHSVLDDGTLIYVKSEDGVKHFVQFWEMDTSKEKLEVKLVKSLTFDRQLSKPYYLKFKRLYNGDIITNDRETGSVCVWPRKFDKDPVELFHGSLNDIELFVRRDTGQIMIVPRSTDKCRVFTPNFDLSKMV